jgi:hypothetical protein
MMGLGAICLVREVVECLGRQVLVCDWRNGLLGLSQMCRVAASVDYIWVVVLWEWDFPRRDDGDTETTVI